MADIEFKITGGAELERALEELPLKASRRIVRQETTPAAALWAEEMRARVRRGMHREPGGAAQFGVIADGIVQRTTVRSDLSATARVGPAAKIYWAKFVEYGTRVRHGRGAMPAFPFGRPAFESRKGAVLERFISGIRSALNAVGLRLS